MTLRNYIQTSKAALRLVREVSPRLLFKFAYNFGIKSMLNINRFEKRVKEGKPFFPAFVMISLTSSCNLSCVGCWVSQKPHRALSVEQLEGIIVESKKNGSYFFGILGGEPLLYKGLFEILERHKDCYFQLFTNGTLLTESIALRLRKAGNVTPLISIEGLEAESDRRRGCEGVFGDTISGVEACRKAGLVIGAAASICKSNLKELTTPSYLDFLAKKGVHYLWYYIYRPVGANPDFDNALSEQEIISLRKFIVQQRCSAPLMIIDAYWDDKGNAICPAAIGLSHHISPSGAIEFCPPLQAAADFLNKDSSNLSEIFASSKLLSSLRSFTASRSRGCIIMEDPKALADFLESQGAIDSSARDSLLKEYRAMPPLSGHNIDGAQIKEKNPFYRLAKKRYFFGFGAYG